MLGIAAEPPRPSVPALAPPIVTGPSVVSVPASKIPVLAPTLAPVAPPRRSRAPVLAGVVAGAVLLGGGGWLLLRPGSTSEPAPAGSPDAADAAVGAPASGEAAASKQSLEPPADPDQHKQADDEGKGGEGGGRSRPVRKFARRLGL
jgi:hypothetical protein